MVRLNQKLLFLLLLLLFLGLVFFIGISFLIKPRIIEIIPSSTQVAEIPQNKTQQAENKTITLILVGDIMLDRGVEYMVEKYGGGDFKFPFLKIAEDLKGVNLLFGNLEGPISDKGTKVGSIYSFRNDPKAIEGLTFAGFDIISLANNHAFDYGREALEDTILRLKEAGINAVGLGTPVVKEIKGTKIAFLAYTNSGLPFWGVGWADWENVEEIKREIEETKRAADILIVSLHAGEEYQKAPNQFQTDFFKMAAESGADIVFGHHPHVVQPGLYSLGNFVFDQSFSEETMQGQMIKVLIENGKIKKVIPIKTKLNQYFQPEIEQ